jgi:hypothetical protein
MKTITTQINLFSFDELSEEAKEYALNKHVENLYFSDDDLILMFMQNNKLDTDLFKFVYSGFCSQGDGGRFEFKSLYGDNLKPFVKHIFKSGSAGYKKVLYAIENKALCVSFNLNNYGYHYQHENGFYLDVDHDDTTPQNETLFKGFLCYLQEWFKDKSRTIYKELEEAYFYECSEEYFKEYCEEYECLFLITGELYHGEVTQ